MNCRNAFQIYLNLENCMTNGVSLFALKKREIYRKELRNDCVWISRFLHFINGSDKLFHGM